MNFKRIMVLALAACMLFSLVSCASNAVTTPSSDVADPGTTPSDTSNKVVLSPDNPVTISAWITTAETAPAPDNKLTKLLKDKLGVTIEYEIVTPDNVDQAIGVMIAGGDYPDLVGTTDLKLRLLEAGALRRLDDYLATGNYPKLSEYVEPYLKQMSYSGTAVEPGLYIFPNYNRFFGEIQGGTHWGTGFWIQKRVLEDAGYPDLSNMTLEKYFSLIENFMKKYPETEGQPTIGFEVLASQGREWGLTNPPQFLAGYPNNGGVVVDENNVATIFADKQIAKDYYQFLNQMYAKGLVDPESFTQTFDQYIAKLATGRVLGMHDQRWNFGQANDALIAAGKPELTWVATMPTYAGADPWYMDRDVMNINQGFGVSVSTKQPEVCLTFLDTMLTDEWQKILSWGIQGEDYLVDDNGVFYRTQQQRDNYNDVTWRSSNRLMALRDVLPKHNGSFDDGNAYSPDEQPGEFFDSLLEYDQKFLQAYGKQTWRQFLNQPKDNPPYYPCWNIALSEEVNQVNQQLNDTSVQYLPKIIMDSPENFEKNWAEYVAAIGKIDYKKYEDAINAGIQERIKNAQ